MLCNLRLLDVAPVLRVNYQAHTKSEVGQPITYPFRTYGVLLLIPYVMMRTDL